MAVSTAICYIMLEVMAVKKITAMVVCLVLAFLIAGCGRQNDIQSEYGISYKLGDLADLFIFTPTSAKQGDNVEIRTHVLYDADIHVFVNGQEIEKSHYDSDYWGYSFVMPQSSVSVTARPFSKSEIGG